MSTITTEDGTQIHSKDWVSGATDRVPPRVAAQRDARDAPMISVASRGFRWTAHDRRGH